MAHCVYGDEDSCFSHLLGMDGQEARCLGKIVLFPQAILALGRTTNER